MKDAITTKQYLYKRCFYYKIAIMKDAITTKQ